MALTATCPSALALPTKRWSNEADGALDEKRSAKTESAKTEDVSSEEEAGEETRASSIEPGPSVGCDRTATE